MALVVENAINRSRFPTHVRIRSFKTRQDTIDRKRAESIKFRKMLENKKSIWDKLSVNDDRDNQSIIFKPWNERGILFQVFMVILGALTAYLTGYLIFYYASTYDFQANLL